MVFLLMMIEDEEERVSFQKLYEETYRKFIYVARGILHNEADAEEVVHDVYVKWARDYRKYKWKSLTDMTRLGIVMTKNQCIDLMRKRERHPEISVEINDDLLGESGMDDGQEDILDGIVSEENIAELVKAMQTLKEDERVLLMLRYDQGFTYKEVAKEMGIHEGTVKTKLFRVKKKLREVLENEWK